MHRRRLLFLFPVLASLAAAPAIAAGRSLTVFAAASLTDVLQAVGAAYTAATGTPVRFSFAASSALARQIEAGAPADLFVSADEDWMDHVARRGLILPESRVDLLSNTLVLIAPIDSRVALRLEPGVPLDAALGEQGRLALADPASVPAGKYAREALTRLGVWQAVRDRAVPADNVRTALNFVARGEAPLGVVYASDARREARVRVVATFPSGTHPPIVYPAAVTRGAGDGAAGLLRFLQGEKARAIFSEAGFGVP